MVPKQIGGFEKLALLPQTLCSLNNFLGDALIRSRLGLSFSIVRLCGLFFGRDVGSAAASQETH